MFRSEWKKGSSKKMSCTIKHYFLNFIKRQISWNFINIFLCSFFHLVKCPYSNWYGFCFHFPRLCNFKFQIFILLSFSNTLAEILLSDGTLISINWHVLFCLCLITISGLLTCVVLSVVMGKSQRVVNFGVSL